MGESDPVDRPGRVPRWPSTASPGGPPRSVAGHQLWVSHGHCGPVPGHRGVNNWPWWLTGRPPPLPSQHPRLIMNGRCRRRRRFTSWAGAGGYPSLPAPPGRARVRHHAGVRGRRPASGAGGAPGDVDPLGVLDQPGARRGWPGRPRPQRGSPTTANVTAAISSAVVESTVNQVITKRMVKKQQMRWSSAGAHLFLQACSCRSVLRSSTTT